MHIRVDNLHKSYPDGAQILSGLNLEINSGEGVVLLGANGCGKSTLLRCMLGLEPISSGDILIDGISLSHAKTRPLRQLRSRIGTVFQQFNLVNNLSVFQNVLFGRLGNDGLLRSLNLTCSQTNRDLAMHCLERVGLADLAKRRTDQLSGGQQQRVAMARMLMQDVQLVFADEPIASLDPRAGREVMDLLFEIVHERRLTVICVLHQLELAQEYAQRIVGLKAGQVLLDGKPSDLSSEQLHSLYNQGAHSQPTAQPTREALHAV